MIPDSPRIFVCLQNIDARKSFDGLAALARDVVGQDPEGGALFVFANRRSNRLKCLWWDRSGYCILYKRLEWGFFRLPSAVAPGDQSVRIDMHELRLILEGISLPPKEHRHFQKMLSFDSNDSLQT
jgi:transposase